jgi:MarR family 2-MHQ and catechol resistance regulon transcriptional repressor
LVRTFGLVERVMQTHFARFGISGAQWGVLRHLHRAELEEQPGLRMTDLGERLLIRPPSVTGVVDRLERAGLVGRNESPHDQRSRLVALTPAGRQLVRRMLTVHERQVETVLAGLETNEQAALQHYLARLGQHLETMLGRGPRAALD